MEYRFYAALLVVGLLFIALGSTLRTIKDLKQGTFKVVDATRLDNCTYQVGMEDKDGFYFSLTQDLVKFSAMGVNVNDILIYGEL